MIRVTKTLNDWEKARFIEAERRYRELKEGKVVGIPAAEVFASLRAELNGKNSPRTESKNLGGMI
ncbi:MAG: addiction module protein [candidate division KSB1 bacterium]